MDEEVNFQFGLEYIAWTESKYHDVEAPSYQDWLEIELQSERFAHESTRRICKIGGDVSAEKIKELEGRVKELEDRIWRLHLIP